MTSYFGKANMLYRNNGDGTFSRITTGSLVTDLPGGRCDRRTWVLQCALVRLRQ